MDNFYFLKNVLNNVDLSNSNLAKRLKLLNELYLQLLSQVDEKKKKNVSVILSRRKKISKEIISSRFFIKK